MMKSEEELINSLLQIRQGIDGFRISTLIGYIQFSESYLLDILNGVKTLLVQEPSLKVTIKEGGALIYTDIGGNCIEFTFEIYNNYKDHILDINQILKINGVCKLERQNKNKL